jgi:hypothetical protein
MKKQLFFGAVSTLLFALPVIVSASTLYSQSISLTPGWNVVSTPRVLDSHTFSAAETSSNFDIYVLDASQSSGWATMAAEGQSEFTPLSGYFVNNKTGNNQTLTLNFASTTSPNQQLFSRSFTTPGWYSLGVANPTYAWPVGTPGSADIDNPGKILNSLSGAVDSVLDFTASLFSINPDAVGLGTQWQAVVPSDAVLLNDFRETKAYAVHVFASSTYIGFQNSDVPAAPASPSISIQNNAAVAPQNIGVNVNNQPLGGFTVGVVGTPVTVSSLTIHVATSSGAIGRLTNVSLVNQNGSTVAGPFDASLDGSTVTFTGSITLPVGTTTYTVKGKVPTGWVNNSTVILSTIPSSDWTASLTLSGGMFTMSTMTVKTAVLSIANGTTPVSQTIVAGGSNILFLNIPLDATQSGEDVRMSSLPVTFAGTGAASSTLSSCQVWNGSTALNTGSQVVNSSSFTSSSVTVSFDNALTIPKGTILTLSVTCNVSAGATGTYQFSINNQAGSYAVTGVTSGSSVLPTIVAGSGPLMTVASGGSLAVSTDSSAPSYSIVAGGTTGVTANVIKFRASNEAVNLTKVGLTLTSGNASDLTQVNIYAGTNIMTTSGVPISANTLLGTATFLGNNISATSTLSTSVQLPVNQDATLIIKADIADIGTNQPGTEGDLIAINYLSSEGNGVNSGSTVRGTNGITAGTGVAGLRVFNTYPIVSLDATQSLNTPAGGVLMQFKVTADSHGAAGIDKFTFNVATTSNITVTNVQLNAYTDAGYSQAVSGTYGATTGQFGSTQAVIPQATNFSIAASTNPLQVSAGQTVYFKLTASIAGAVSGSSATTKLLGDSAYDGMKAVSNITGNMIWSPNATTTSNIIGGSDWTNGYGITGLPATGLIKTISQ